ncbi:MAG: hypothetical protein ACFCVF_06620 [Kineosporiaceae bacterium]
MLVRAGFRRIEHVGFAHDDAQLVALKVARLGGRRAVERSALVSGAVTAENPAPLALAAPSQ